VALVRLGAVTHGNDMDQRFVWLSVTARDRTDKGWRLTTAPLVNAATAPPGDYQVVVVDSTGTPSPGQIVRVSRS